MVKIYRRGQDNGKESKSPAGLPIYRVGRQSTTPTMPEEKGKVTIHRRQPSVQPSVPGGSQAATQDARTLESQHQKSKAPSPSSRNNDSQQTGESLPGLSPDKPLNNNQWTGLPIQASLEANEKILRSFFAKGEEIVYRKFHIGGPGGTNAMLVFCDQSIDYMLLQRDLLAPLIGLPGVPPGGVTVDWLINDLLPLGYIDEANEIDDLIRSIARNFIILLIDGQTKAIEIKLVRDISRGVSEPTVETVLKGPADAFNEDLRTNLALVKKRIHSPNVAVEYFRKGDLTNANFVMVYINGLVSEQLLQEVRSRIDRIDVDSLISSNEIEEYLQDSPLSLFSTIDSTERPDKVVGNLLDGRVALLFDNTPFALIFPITIGNQAQSPEDYYTRFWYASFIRLTRWLSMNIVLLVPSFYVALVTFHQELIPTKLLLSVAASREGVPFPGVVEALLMEFTFEILREAGIRLPRPFGQTISIVGAVVVGQAAVSAGLVSPVMVVVVSLTAISSYTIPSLTLANSLRLLRFPLIMLTGVFGIFGLLAGLMIITFHMCSLRSFGVPYLSPLAPTIPRDFADTLIRVPFWANTLRPRLHGYVEPQQQAKGQKPGPPKPNASKRR